MHLHRGHLEETVIWGTITWSEMIGKQNIQAKKVYECVRCCEKLPAIYLVYLL